MMDAPSAVPLIGRRYGTESSSTRLRGILKLLEGPLADATPSASSSTLLPIFDFDPMSLHETQSSLQKKRRRRNNITTNSMSHCSPYPHSRLVPYPELVSLHRFVCFFFIQKNSSDHYSPHTLRLRRILATEYNDSMTIFVVQIGDNNSNRSYPPIGLSPDTGLGGDDDATDSTRNQQHYWGGGDLWYNNTNSSFCLGTGFCTFPALSVVTTLMNVTQLPTVVIVDTTTGRSLPSDAILAVERNDSHTVINSWQQGKSGLSFVQKVITILTCESSCSGCSIM